MCCIYSLFQSISGRVLYKYSIQTMIHKVIQRIFPLCPLYKILTTCTSTTTATGTTKTCIHRSCQVEQNNNQEEEKHHKSHVASNGNDLHLHIHIYLLNHSSIYYQYYCSLPNFKIININYVRTFLLLFCLVPTRIPQNLIIVVINRNDYRLFTTSIDEKLISQYL